MARKLSFLPTAEELVAAKHTDEGEDMEAVRRLDDARRGIRFDPEYKAKNRAEYLRSLQVVRDFSPSERLTIRTPKDSPYRYRFCDPAVRHKRGWDPFVPLNAENDDEWNEALSVCPTKTLRKENGRIMAGELVLCRIPVARSEAIAALAFQRSQQRSTAAAKGAVTTGAGQASPAVPSFESMHEHRRPGDDVGVRMTGSLRDDPNR